MEIDYELIRIIVEVGGVLLLGVGGAKYTKIVELVFVLIDSIEMAHKMTPNNGKRIIESRSVSKGVDKKLDAMLRKRGYIHE